MHTNISSDAFQVHMQRTVADGSRRAVLSYQQPFLSPTKIKRPFLLSQKLLSYFMKNLLDIYV